MLGKYKNRLRAALTLMLALSVGTVAAVPVNWTVDAVLDSPGFFTSTVFGTFDFDADTSQYSNVMIEVDEVTLGLVEFTDADLGGGSGDFLLELIQPQGADLTGSTLLVLQFINALAPGGGPYTIGNGLLDPISFVGTCDNSDCSSAGAFADVVEGGVFETAAVPVPAAIWLFGSGLLGLAGMSRRCSGA